jgi:hypothetical protein
LVQEAHVRAMKFSGEVLEMKSKDNIKNVSKGINVNLYYL